MVPKPDISTVELVVKSALGSWTALQLAIQHGFVEGNTEEKFSLLSDDLVNICNHESVDQFAIEELLESAAYHDFNFLDEDKSYKDLAKAIVVCFSEIKSADIKTVITKHFPSASDALQKSSRGKDMTVEVDEESALSEMVCDSSIEDESTVNRKQEPIIDDDGFQLVQSRRKR